MTRGDAAGGLAAQVASALVCSGCGYSAAAAEPYPFRCPRAGTDDGDHVMVRMLDPTRVGFPDPAGRAVEPDPFLRYRSLLHAAQLATAGSLGDDGYRALVQHLEDELTRLDGHGFGATPFGRHRALSDALGSTGAGGTWVKDETGNVSGSHKGRHLMGLVLHLEVVERLGLVDRGHRPHLAIASCGNAALAAAVVAAAAGRRLKVFVPVDADPHVLERLHGLGAHVAVCPREPGVVGDPTYLRLQTELANGAIPFTCQGTENGLAIEGGLTLGYEMATDLAASGDTLDHVVVQVGGGALASAVLQGLREAVQLGALGHLPQVHTVQTSAAYPLARAYDRVRAMLPAEPTAAEVDRAAAHRGPAPVVVHVAVGQRAQEHRPRHPRRRDLRLASGRRGDARDLRRAGGGGRGAAGRGQRAGRQVHRDPRRPDGLRGAGRPAGTATVRADHLGRAGRGAVHRRASLT